MNMQENFQQLSMEGLTCQPLGYGKTEAHNPVPPIRVKPFLKDPRLCPVYQMVILERILGKLRPKSVMGFWLSSKSPHKPITPSTMCGLLKEVILDAGSM